MSAPLPPPLPSSSPPKKNASVGFEIASNSTSNRIKDVVGQCRKIVGKVSEKYASSRWLLQNVTVSSRLQGDRPMCGLVALSMAAEIAQRSPIANGELTPDDKQLEHKDIEELFCLAQQKGFTQNGEMFSAEDLAELAQSFYGLSSSVTSRGLEDVRHVLSHLAEGNPVLVPYDAAKNHEPCIAQGHRAHWAVLTGFLCKSEDDGFEWSTVEEDIEQPLLYHSYCGVSIPNNLDRDHIYFLAKQGKSRHCGVWPSGALCESNFNLVEFDPLKKTEDFTLPVGGIEEGLCGKIILITLSNL